jgi:hypothetical protein
VESERSLILDWGVTEDGLEENTGDKIRCAKSTYTLGSVTEHPALAIKWETTESGIYKEDGS